MLARGLRVDARRGHGFAGPVAVGEFVEQRAADRARRALLARAVHRHEQAAVGVGEPPPLGMEHFRLPALRDRAITLAPFFVATDRTRVSRTPSGALDNGPPALQNRSLRDNGV